MRHAIASCLAAMMTLASPVASSGDVVVELFTSQGCSSCPPADALLAEIVDREGIIALSLHVDYWDYLGWKDEFARAEFTQRQRGYASLAGSSYIYTPQMVIDGTSHIIGTKAMKLSDALMAHARRPEAAQVEAKRQGDKVRLRIEPAGETPGGLAIYVVSYAPSKTVSIRRGENAGRQMTYHNVVVGWQKLTDWDGGATLEATFPLERDTQAAVIVQSGFSGPIIAAGKVAQ